MVWKQGWASAFVFFLFLFGGVKICTIVKFLIDNSHKHNNFWKKIAKKKFQNFKESKNHQIFTHGSSK
jgi:hypothetical protein